jgi:ribosomal protein L12E/L44/L45/RPP1/RPP2
MEMTTKITDVTDIKTTGVKTYQTTAFKPRPALLLDVLPEENMKNTPPAAVQKAGTKPAGNQKKPDEILVQLLKNAETFAQRTRSSKMRWQLATLVTGTLLVAAGLLIGLMSYEMTAGGMQKGRLEMENQTLKSQVNSAGVQVDGLKKEIENLKRRNAEAAVVPRSFAATAIPAASIKKEQKPVENNRQQAAAAEQVIDTSRVEAIKKGKYPMGASKTELMAALGQPDRVYSARHYEQLLYFGQKPGRFWFIGGYLVQTSD